MWGCSLCLEGDAGREGVRRKSCKGELLFCSTYSCSGALKMLLQIHSLAWQKLAAVQHEGLW